MIRHTLLPAPGEGAIRDGGSSGHITSNTPTADTNAAGPADRGHQRRGPGRPPHHC